MTAREKFQIGDRVRMSAEGLRRHRGSRAPTTGKVVGFCRGTAEYGVRVLRDGRKTVVTVHAPWWEVDLAAGNKKRDALLRAAVTYADTIQDDDVTEFTGESVLNAALEYARSLSKADRERLGR